MCGGDQQAGTDVLSSRKRFRKRLWGLASSLPPPHPPPPALYVRGLKFNHSYLYPSKVPVSVPFGFPAVSVWRGVYSVRCSSNSCCHLLISMFAILAMFGGSSPDNSWNLTPFCPATLTRLPLPPFSFVIFTADVNCSNIGKNPPNVVNFFEKVMYNQMIEFAEQYNILYRCQFGFRKNYSTCHVLIHLINRVSSAIDPRGNYCRCVPRSLQSFWHSWSSNLIH